MYIYIYMHVYMCSCDSPSDFYASGAQASLAPPAKPARRHVTTSHHVTRPRHWHGVCLSLFCVLPPNSAHIMHACTHINKHAYFVHAHVHTPNIAYIHTYMWAFMLLWENNKKKDISINSLGTELYMTPADAYTHACTHAHTHTYAHTHATRTHSLSLFHTHILTNTRIHTHTHEHTPAYTHMYTYTHTSAHMYARI